MKNTLKQYNSKRDFHKTNEPKGKKQIEKKKLKFVVQHHWARKEHYDIRLEYNGVLKSWAVPKGPSYDSKQKRLAIEVEDHPIDYQHFEGTIPKGQYGGGTVMIFDYGNWIPLENVKESFKKGNIKFLLQGKRLKGQWTLIHMKENQWLLRKEKDNYEKYQNIENYNTSARTSRTKEEIEQGKKIQKIKNSKKKGIVEYISITSPDKIIFEKSNITKLEIAKYYQKISSRMLPYLENRLISTIRAPKGSRGEKFFKKHFNQKNQGLGKIVLPNKSGKKEDYYYIKNIEGMMNEIQMNGFEFHIWGSKVQQLNQPDMLVFDLDPDEKMNLKTVREGVKDLKSILDNLSLISFLKTSGGKGYHIVVPIHSIKKWKEFREFAQNIAKLMETKWPEKYVSNMRKEKRKNKIFIDWIRNTKGATSVAPYSLRIRKDATVSMPISWQELDKVKPDEITIQEAMKRLRRKDPWENFFQIEQ